MATTRRRKPAFTIRTVRTKQDRKRPSVFMRLKVDEAFKMYALFEPDPELDDNPGFFEYYDHYDKQGNAYVPCTGESCPFCAANDNPSTRALTAWLDPSAGDKAEQIKVFTMNFSTTQDMSDEAEDEGGVLGKMVRVKRLSDRGDYRVKITTDKPLTQKATKDAMSALEEKFPNGLQGLVERQLEVQMERLKALEAMEDDDDEDEEREERSTARRGRATNSKTRSRADEDEEENDGDEEEEEGESSDEETSSVEEQELELLSVSKRNNSVTVEIDGEEAVLAGDEDEIDVSDFRKGDVAVVSAEWDEEDEVWVLTSIEATEGEQESEEGDEEDEEADEDGEGEEGEEEEEEANSIEGGEYEVVRVEADDEILHLQNDDGKVKMWVGEGVNPDYDAIKKGVTVTLDAQTDDEGDWIVTAVKVKPARRTTTRKQTTARKTTSTARKTTSRSSRKK